MIADMQLMNVEDENGCTIAEQLQRAFTLGEAIRVGEA